MLAKRGKLCLALIIILALVWFIPRMWAAAEERASNEQKEAVGGEAQPSAGEAQPAAEEPAAQQKESSSVEEPAGAKQSLDDKVAKVNGVIIKRSDFDKESKHYQRQLSMTGKPLTTSQISDMQKDVLENLIRNELLYQASQKAGISVDDASVKEKMDSMKKRFPTDAEYQNLLSKMNVTEADLNAQLRRAGSIEKLVDKEIVQKITVPEKEIKEFYDKNPDFFKQPEQVKASHILVKVDAKATPEQKAEARKKIEDIQKKLKGGADFAELAKQFSDCPSSAKGGDLGSFRRGQMVKPFEEAAFALKPGELSDIVETNFGFHLIKVTEKKPETIIPYDEVKKDKKLEQYLKQEKVQKELTAYVEKLKEKAKIEKYLETVTEAPAKASTKASK